MEKLIINKNKGITLIALVITIIVLLILAGVSIAMLTGENGILNQAKKAKEETEIASEEEKVKLATSGALLQDNGKSIIQSNLQSELSKYFDTEDFSVSSGTNDEGKNGFIVTVTESVKEGRKYFVSQNGKVEKYEEPQVAELTDIYLNLYDDGTLVFSNNSELMEGKTLEKSYGNIKGKTFGQEMSGNTMTLRLPYITIENITQDNFQEAIEQIMAEASKIKKVVIKNEIVPDSMAYWFSSLINLTEISGFENLDTSNVADMSYMFYSCSSLSSINLSELNTSNVIDMSLMFSGCSSLSSINLSGLNTSNVIDMSSMFSGCSSLSGIDLTSIDTSNVIDMKHIFSGCSSLNSINLDSLNTSNVVDINGMFYNCTGLTNLELSNFNTGNVTNMMMLFDGCSNLKTVNLQSFNTEKVTNMMQMFYRCENLESLDIGSFNITEETEITNMLIDSNGNSLQCTVYVKNEQIKNILKNYYQNEDLIIEVKQ